MARKPNYDFEKRRKELERKNKKDAKRADRQARRDQGLPDDLDGLGITPGADDDAPGDADAAQPGDDRPDAGTTAG